MKVLMVHYMGYIEDRTSHGNLDSLFVVISLRGEYLTVLGYSVGDLGRFSKGFKDGNFMLLVMVN